MITILANASSDEGLREQLAEILSKLGGLSWGMPLIFLLLLAGLWFTVRLGVMQVRMFGHAIAIVAGKYDDPNKKGEITHFQALCAALSATIGVGNIEGVATALHMGGRGAFFWMWVAGFLGMATKFATCTLAQVYRKEDENGVIAGGPMYYIRMGLGPRFAWLAMPFALSTVIASFGGGNMVQSGEMARVATEEVQGLLLSPSDDPQAEAGAGPDSESFWFWRFRSQDEENAVMIGSAGEETRANRSLQKWGERKESKGGITPLRILLGLVVAGIVGLVILGGIKRIGSVASKLVPGMSILYCAGALYIVFSNLSEVPVQLSGIFTDAFNFKSAQGGAVGSAFLALTWGIKRAVFSNEAGLGSAPIAHAAAKTDEPVREGMVAMLGPFIDTLMICTLTSLAILVTHEPAQYLASLGGKLDGAALTKSAFVLGINENFGTFVIALGLVLFAISTAISWSYYGDRAVEYAFGKWAITPYRAVFVFFLFLGANIKIAEVWDFADFTMASMAFWNLIGVLGLSGLLIRLTKDYLGRDHKAVDRGQS